MGSQATCKKCGKPIVWLKTRKGKNMPTNPDGVREGDIFDVKRHVSHFDTCPAADSFRSQGGKKKTEPPPVGEEENIMTEDAGF